MPINECALGLDNCDVNAVCTDTATSFECACLSGYSGKESTVLVRLCLHLLCLRGQIKGNYSSIILKIRSSLQLKLLVTFSCRY